MRIDALPTFVPGPLRIAAKAGFLTKRIWSEFFGTQDRTWRFRRWQNLMETGYFKPVPDYGFIESAVTLTEKGKEVADALGFNSVYSPPAKNLWHDEELVRFALFMECQGWITNWTTEQELKVNDSGNSFFKGEERAKKIPDLIIEWNTTPKKVMWAIELERTRKEFSRYYDMVGAYKGISKIESVLVIVAANSIETNIKKAQSKMDYPQDQRPMLFASMNEITTNPSACELRQGSNRMALGKFANAMIGIRTKENDLQGKIPSNKPGNNVA